MECRAAAAVVLGLLTLGCGGDGGYSLEQCLAAADTAYRQDVRTGYLVVEEETRVQAASLDELQTNRVRFAQGEPYHAVLADFRCPGRGVCRPDSLTFGLAAVVPDTTTAADADTLRFLLSPGDGRIAAPVYETVSRPRQTPVGDTVRGETVRARLAYTDFERLACADSATFEAGPYRRALARADLHRFRNLLRRVGEGGAPDTVVGVPSDSTVAGGAADTVTDGAPDDTTPP